MMFGEGISAVGVLVVLVDANAVEARPFGELELVQVLVVGLVHDLARSYRCEGGVDPDAGVLLREVHRQLRVRHQMEPVKLHVCPP